MSLSLNFEPHSWYKNFAIKDNRGLLVGMDGYTGYHWSAYTENGNTGYIDEEHANTLHELKELISQYEHDRKEHMAYLYRQHA